MENLELLTSLRCKALPQLLTGNLELHMVNESCSFIDPCVMMRWFLKSRYQHGRLSDHELDVTSNAKIN